MKRKALSPNHYEQTSVVLQHLKKYKSITSIGAIVMYQIFRLAARIYELRAEGWKIKTVMINSPNGRKYAKYRLLK